MTRQLKPVLAIIAACMLVPAASIAAEPIPGPFADKDTWVFEQTRKQQGAKP